ncbi:DNA glycosylase AlkZ-like family protein, partial [Victivallis vadensis]|uniref:DNA glycosylase AlkZ-like family protein n=1 Tax=Victivallis vadensis TaxID=172901 RepID=UPI003AF99CC8
MNIPLLRVLNQQLLRPQFRNPAELVSWMGAVQAQDFHWMKWALGVRLRPTGIGKIDNALKQGEILRLHIMRPTWHFVAAKDIR